MPDGPKVGWLMGDSMLCIDRLIRKAILDYDLLLYDVTSTCFQDECKDNRP